MTKSFLPSEVKEEQRDTGSFKSLWAEVVRCGTKAQREHHASLAFDPLGLLSVMTSKGRVVWGGEETEEKADGVLTNIYHRISLISQEYRLKRNICMFDSGLG